MHQGCFVWTPGPGPARVCVSMPFLAGLGRLASQARFGAPNPFPWPVSVPSLLALPLRAGVALLVVVGVFFLFCSFFSLSFVRPRCLWRSVFSGPRCLGPRCLVVPPPPLFFFFLFSLISPCFLSSDDIVC